MAFTYKDYKESDKVKKYGTALSQTEQAKPSDWSGGTYGQSLNDAMNRVLNREKFTYDLNGDALYQQYKNQYINQGRQAMMDTMGQAAALTGGYGNSYAQTVGQQTYQGYLQGLNDKIPELYQLALDKYNQEGADLMNQYGILADRYSTDYGEWRDSYNDWLNNRDYAYNAYNNERNFDYGMYGDNRNFAYQNYRDQIADDQWNKSFNLSQQRLYSSTKNPEGGGDEYDTHGYSEGQIASLQRKAGIEVTGKWDENTDKAYEAGYRWNSYTGGMVKDGNGQKMNPDNFNAYMSSIAAQLRSGKADAAMGTAQTIANSLNDEQFATMRKVFSQYGIAIN